jgi:hypothetical protein
VKTEYTYEGATFEVECDVDWMDSKDNTFATIVSIKHAGVEFWDILPLSTIQFIEEQINNRMEN